MKPANIFFRNDTMLGVCEAIGQDFGFHPNWLRIALAGGIFFAPLAVIGGYLAAGVIVAATRWIAPDELVEAPVVPVGQFELLEAGIDSGEDDVRLAA